MSAPEGQAPVCIVDNACDREVATVQPITACDNVSGVELSYREEVLAPWWEDKLKRLEVCLTSKKRCQ